MTQKVFLLFVFVCLVAVGCAPYSTEMVATGGATQVSDLGFKIPKNSQGNTAEQQNIIDRLKVTTDPTKVLWIHLMTAEGRILQRLSVTRKVTSSGKRLEPVTAASRAYQADYYPQFRGADGKWYATSEFMQPDGTYGSSDSYIFWFDTLHRYHQWGTQGMGLYLLTDYPIDIQNPMDLVTGMYNMNRVAFEWQKTQEQILCKQEGRTWMKEGECK